MIVTDGVVRLGALRVTLVNSIAIFARQVLLACYHVGIVDYNFFFRLAFVRRLCRLAMLAISSTIFFITIRIKEFTIWSRACRRVVVSIIYHVASQSVSSIQ